MSTDMAGVASLGDCAIRLLGAVGVNLVGAVVLEVLLAVVASKIGTNLSTNTGAIANLDTGDLGANLDDLANDLVSYAERKRDILSPSTGDGVNIRGADTTGVDSNVDIVLLKFLQWQLGLVSTVAFWTALF